MPSNDRPDTSNASVATASAGSRPRARRPRSRQIRRITAVAVALLAAPSGADALGPCWTPPTDAPVIDPYRDPACRWCPGNRGIEYDTAPGSPIRAVAAGTVTFAGPVAGIVYLVIVDAAGRRVTYGGLGFLRFGRGDAVPAGVVVGVSERPFHLGVREGDRYVDPQPLLGRLVHRPRLVPVDGGRPNPAAPPTLRCGT